MAVVLFVFFIIGYIATLSFSPSWRESFVELNVKHSFMKFLYISLFFGLIYFESGRFFSGLFFWIVFSQLLLLLTYFIDYRTGSENRRSKTKTDFVFKLISEDIIFIILAPIAFLAWGAKKLFRKCQS